METDTAAVADGQHAISTFAETLEGRVVESLGLVPLPGFESLATVEDLHGQPTGYARVYHGGVIEKAAFLSLNFMPGMRYFNVHLIPQARYRIPRFSFEGMLSLRGSQVSVDLYPDMDAMLNLDYFNHHYRKSAEAYRQARFDSLGLAIEPSRMLHMRAFASPYMLLAYGISTGQLAEFAEYAEYYMEDWLALCQTPQRCSDSEMEDRIRRRALIMQTIIDCDPDRDKVVMLFGEAVTQQIEKATML